MNYIFAYAMEVRDYECDIQGIVNNANYMHYTEHARHAYIESLNIHFDELHRRGIDVVVAAAELRFKRSLKPRDRFEVRLSVAKDGLRYVFFQDIFRMPCATRSVEDASYSKELLCFRAKTDIVAIVNGKLADCPELNEKFGF